MTLDELKNILIVAKSNEEASKKARIAIEQKIINHPDVVEKLKAEGAVTVEGVTITCGYTRKWDQDKLAALNQSIRDDFFPFRREYVEDRKATRECEREFPELWEKIRDALTLGEKKPSVTIKEVKQ
jgi:tRNA-dihydrouridine synthase